MRLLSSSTACSWSRCTKQIKWLEKYVMPQPRRVRQAHSRNETSPLVVYANRRPARSSLLDNPLACSPPEYVRRHQSASSSRPCQRRHITIEACTHEPPPQLRSRALGGRFIAGTS